MRKSETRKPNAANSVPDSFQAFGLKEAARDIRDTELFETANDEPENPGEWTHRETNSLKSKPLVQSKRPRERLQISNTRKNDELRRMGTSSTANKRKSDQKRRR